MREVCCRFLTKSYSFTENPLSTAVCSWDKVNTILKTVQHFLYLAFPYVRSTNKEPKHNFFSLKLKSVCVPSGQKKLVENISFLLHRHALTRFNSNYTAYQLACQNGWHFSACQIPCYQVGVRMGNMQVDI